MSRIKEFALFTLVIFFIFAVVFGFIFINNFAGKTTGKAVLDLSPNYIQGQILNGVLNISLNQGELIPSSSQVIITSGNTTQKYSLSSLVSEPITQGNYYVQGTSLSGSGNGYGLEGVNTNYSNVYFTLKILLRTSQNNSNPVQNAVSENSTNNIKTIENTTPIENQSSLSNNSITENSTTSISQSNNSSISISQPLSNETLTPPPTETNTSTTISTTTPIVNTTSSIETQPTVPPENLNPPAATTTSNGNSSSSSPSSPITGNVISNTLGGFMNLFNRITGHDVANVQTQINGQVTANQPFTYTLNNGMSAEIVPGSVRTNSGSLSDNLINLEIKNGVATVTTSYIQTQQGFGQNFLGNTKKNIIINLSTLGFTPTDSSITVNLVNNNVSILSINGNLNQSSINNQIPNSTNLSINVLPAILTNSEKTILTQNLGDNFSVQVTNAQRTNSGIVVRQEVGNYWIEKLYDNNLTPNQLKAQVEVDRIRWLKDLAKTLSETNNNSQTINGLIGNYPV